MELSKIICPSCSKETPVAESGEGFCLYCGAKLSAPAPHVSGLSEEIKQIYEDYLRWVVEFFQASSSFALSMTSFFTGTNEFKKHSNHNVFIEKLKLAAQNVSNEYAAGTLSREEVIDLLHFVMLEDHDHGVSEAKWMFLAAEQFFEPLLSVLTPDEATEFFTAYKAARRKDPGFPVQQKILKTLKKMKK